MRAGLSPGTSARGERPSGDGEPMDEAGEGEGGGASTTTTTRDHITGEAATYMCGALSMSERTVEQVCPWP